MSKWISCRERLPRPLVDVAVAYRNLEGRMVVDFGFMRHAGAWYFNGTAMRASNVEYWQHLPPPPEVEA